jgi:hypothetical protein
MTWLQCSGKEWTRTRGSVFRILESVEDILKTLESNILRKLREDELNELEAQGTGEDCIILREVAWRGCFGGFWKRDIHRMEGSKCGSPPSWFERDQFRTLLVQSNPSAEIWRIAGSHAAPYHFGLEVDSGPLLCNQTMAQNRLLCPCEPSPFKIHSSISQGRFFSQDGIVLRQLPRKSLLFRITSSTRLFSICLANLFSHCNFFFWRTNCFFLSPLPNDRSL